MKKYFGLFMIALFMSACATVPTDDIKVDAEADPKVNFAGYKTYAWLGSAGILRDPEGKWEPPKFDADAEIVFLIDRELRSRGMTEASSNPDLLVAYALGVDMAALKIKENPETQMGMLKTVPQGALMVVLIDPKTGFVIWVGAATAEVQKNKDTEIVKKRLEYAVTQMMKKLPK